MELRDKIRNIRISRGLNQKQFAELINATLPAVSNWETGRNKPNHKRLMEIAKLEGKTVDELLGIDQCVWILKEHDETYYMLHKASHSINTQCGKRIDIDGKKISLIDFNNCPFCGGQILKAGD